MFEKFFRPQTIAVIGASTDPKKLGHILVKNILESGYQGRVYPINNKSDGQITILNHRVYPDIHDIHEVAELIIISIPPQFVFDELMKSYVAGTRNFVIITAGFKEIGDTKNEQLINKFIEIHPDVNLLGPNCLGFIDTSTPLNASFSASFPQKGNISFFSQSGALCSAILDWSDKVGMGFAQFISIGNKNDINENTFLELTIKEGRTNPMFFYLESFNDGKKFIELAQKIKTPIIVLHPGRYSETASAMQSHTGSLASNDKVVDEALREAGVIRAYGLEDMMDLMMIFNFYAENNKNQNVAIVSNAGGPGIITTDSIRDMNLDLAKLDEITKTRLAEKLPRTANIHNPVDLVGDAMADRYGYALDLVLADSNVDAVVVLLTPQAMTQIDVTAEYIQRLAKQHNKIVLASFMGGKRVDKYEQYLFSYGIPYFDYPERAIWALSKLNIVKPNPENDAPVTRTEMESFLNLKSPQEQFVTTEDETIAFLPESKIALKLISDKLLHKTDTGGVKLGLDTAEKRTQAFTELKQLGEEMKSTDPDFRYQIQAQEMVKIDTELFLGAKRDPNFGDVVVFGLGGIYANILDETMLFLPHGDRNYIKNKISSSKVGKIVLGARGQKGIEIDKVINLIFDTFAYMRTNNTVADIDINPLGIIGEDLYAIDVKTRKTNS